MLDKSATHPELDELAAFSAGRLAPGSVEQRRIERHIADCEECCRRLEALPPDALGKLIREPDTTPDLPPSAPGRPDDDPHPDVLREHPRYRVLRKLGGGGMGVVYEAEHRLMGRQVAIKLIHHQFVEHRHAVERFRQEVKAAARLDHPNIVRAFDAGCKGGEHFLVMEYVDGMSLAELVGRAGPLPVRKSCLIARRVAAGLEHARVNGIMHRDVKPQNVMVGRDGQVKVLDFGLARLLRLDETDTDNADPESALIRTTSALTQMGAIIGTPDYIAPEQTDDSHRVDTRADVYSLGCTLYFMLAGRPPFPVAGTMAKLVAHREQQATSIESLRSDVPAGLAAVVARLMTKSPEERIQTPGEVDRRLEPFTRAPVTNAVERSADLLPLPSIEPPVARRPRRRPKSWHWALPLVALIAVAVGLWFLFGQASNDVRDGDAGNGKSAEAAAEKGPPWPRILMVVPHEDLWLADYEPFRKALVKGGATVQVASSAITPATSILENSERGPPVQPDLLLPAARAEEFDAVVFSGKYTLSPEPSEYLGDGDHARAARRLIESMLADEKIVAGVCSGTNVLAQTTALNRRSAASHEYIDWSICNRAGAHWIAEPLVADGPVITAGNWSEETADEFSAALLKRVRSRRRSAAGR